MTWDRLSRLVAKLLLRLYPPGYRRRFAAEWEEATECLRQDLGAGQPGRSGRTAPIRGPLRWLAFIVLDTMRALPVAYIAALRRWVGVARDRLGRDRGSRITAGSEHAEGPSTPTGLVRGRREWCAPGGGFSWLDFKLGLRMLAKYPGLTMVGGFAMTFAIGVGAGAFEFVSQVLYPTLPLDEGDRIVAIRLWHTAESEEEPRALHDFVGWREELRAVRELGAFRTRERNLITGDGRGLPVEVAEITASGFRMARTPPLLGRALIPADEAAGAAPVVVLGYQVWQRRFAGDRAPRRRGREAVMAN